MEFSNSSLGQRIKEAREKVGLTQDKLSSLVGISKRSLGYYEKDEKEPTISIVKLIAKYCKISDVWLFNGDRSDNDETYKIDLLSVQVSAGSGIVNHEVEVIDSVEIDKVFFKTIPNLNKLKVVEVIGDSMLPTLKEGDFVVIDESIKNFINDIYVINYGGALFVKRLQFKLDGTIVIISDNKSYESETFDPNASQLDFDIIGKVIVKILK